MHSSPPFYFRKSGWARWMSALSGVKHVERGVKVPMFDALADAIAEDMG